MNYTLPIADIDTDTFPVNFQAGRQRWLTELDKISAAESHEAYRCSGQSPEGEPLFTDTVWLGDRQAQKVVILIGGTHGIEGFAGSAVQIDHLRLLSSRIIDIPDGMALLMIHALTPWGYAWLRRCDADGVDLNRNSIDFSRPLPENPGYEMIRPALFLADAELRARIFSDFESRHGRTALEKAVSAGQYSDPAGPFYGGNKASHGRRVVEQLIDKLNLRQRDLAVIDIHTGLGPYGYGEIICDHEPDSAGTAKALQCYGDSVTLPLLGTSSSCPKTGLLDYAWHAIMNENSCYITLEFGTFPTDQLFEVLLRDHQLWAMDNNDRSRQDHGKRMQRHFCPKDQAWREMVLFRARQVISQAMRGL
ncbi:MAG: DUF2817 domain-containing protein [Gammaproteobacteria bacterium]